MLKRLFDITFSFLGLAFLSPVFLYLSLRINGIQRDPFSIEVSELENQESLSEYISLGR